MKTTKRLGLNPNSTPCQKMRKWSFTIEWEGIELGHLIFNKHWVERFREIVQQFFQNRALE